MRILHICISERYVEGDSYHENILPTKQQKMGHTVTVIASQEYFDGRTKSMKHRETADYTNKDGLHVIILPSNNKNRIYRLLKGTVKGLYETMKKIDPEIVFVHGVKSSDNATIAKYIKNHPNTKLYADNHNDKHVTPIKKGILPWILRKIDVINARKLLPVVQCFWGTLPLRAEYLNKVFKIPEDKIGVLIMGGDEGLICNRDIALLRKTIREKYDVPQDAFLIVTGGAFDKRKQQSLLMEAVEQLQNQQVWLLAFGEPVKGMEGVFEKYRQSERIVMTGWLPSDEAYDMFLASDVAFFPGWHSVLWEQAVACGIPIVVKRWDGVDHIAYNGNAILMEHVDVEEIKKVISDLMFTDKYYKMKELAEIAAPNYYMSHIANRAIGIE